MYCPKCGKKMKEIMRFELGKSSLIHSCCCGFTTKPSRINFQEIREEQEYDGRRKTKLKLSSNKKKHK